MSTPLEEACPDLPAQFAACMATLRDRGVLYANAERDLLPALNELRETLVASAGAAHGLRGKHAIDFARAVIIQELLVRNTLLFQVSAMIRDQEQPLRDRLRAAGLATSTTMSDFDGVASEAIGRQHAVELLSRRFFDGKPFLLSAEAVQAADLSRACATIIDTIIEPDCGQAFAGLLRDGATQFGEMLAEGLASGASQSARRALDVAHAAHATRRTIAN